MTKKTDLSPAKGKRDNGVGDPPPTKIRETVVADPSISFTLDFPEDWQKVNGYLVQHFKAKIYLTDVPNPEDTDFAHIATVKITSLTSHSVYIFVPFGDPDYLPGQSFTLKLKLRGYDPATGQPLQFNNNGNVFFQQLIGGGIVNPIVIGSTNKKTKKK